MTSSPAEAYDRHTGRYGSELSPAFASFARVAPGMRVLDVGCGTGALARELAGPFRLTARAWAVRGQASRPT
jgi:ubiquinone/menaquinone biosynthesis C-methylase UbiE